MQNTTKSNEKKNLKQNYFWKYTENIWFTHFFDTKYAEGTYYLGNMLEQTNQSKKYACVYVYIHKLYIHTVCVCVCFVLIYLNTTILNCIFAFNLYPYLLL